MGVVRGDLDRLSDLGSTVERPLSVAPPTPDRLKPKRIRDLMIMMGFCALYLALGRLTGPGLFFYTIGPVCGAGIHRLLGGSGIKGGIIGGASTYACWVGVALVAFGHSGFGYTEQVCMITVMAVEGAVAGFTVGVLVWVGARSLASWRCLTT
jgi:hypothetical protein